MTLIEKVERAIWGRDTFTHTEEPLQKHRTMSKAAIAVVLKDMHDACYDERRDMTPHNLVACVLWYARENGVSLDD